MISEVAKMHQNHIYNHTFFDYRPPKTTQSLTGMMPLMGIATITRCLELERHDVPMPTCSADLAGDYLPQTADSMMKTAAMTAHAPATL